MLYNFRNLHRPSQLYVYAWSHAQIDIIFVVMINPLRHHTFNCINVLFLSTLCLYDHIVLSKAFATYNFWRDTICGTGYIYAVGLSYFCQNYNAIEVGGSLAVYIFKQLDYEIFIIKHLPHKKIFNNIKYCCRLTGVCNVVVVNPIILFWHYNDVIISATASQITSLAIVYSTVYLWYRSKKTSKPRVIARTNGQ